MTRTDRIAIDGILIWWAMVFLLIAIGSTSWRPIDIPRVGLLGSLFWAVNVDWFAWVLQANSGFVNFIKSKWWELSAWHCIFVLVAMTAAFVLLTSILRPVPEEDWQTEMGSTVPTSDPRSHSATAPQSSQFGDR